MKKQDKSGSSPTVKQPVGAKGNPTLQVKVPGYNKGSGTPGWVKAAANAATKKIDTDFGMEHRHYDHHQAGNPPRGTSPEQIRGGQAGG